MRAAGRSHRVMRYYLRGPSDSPGRPESPSNGNSPRLTRRGRLRYLTGKPEIWLRQLLKGDAGGGRLRLRSPAWGNSPTSPWPPVVASHEGRTDVILD